MRKARWGYYAIAQACGVSAPTARRDVEHMVRYVEATFAEDIAEERQRTAAALDDLHRVAYNIATDPGRKPDQRLRAVDRAIMVSDRRSKLLGLDATTEGATLPSTLNLTLDIAKLTGDELDDELRAFQIGVATEKQRVADRGDAAAEEARAAAA